MARPGPGCHTARGRLGSGKARPSLQVQVTEVAHQLAHVVSHASVIKLRLSRDSSPGLSLPVVFRESLSLRAEHRGPLKT